MEFGKMTRLLSPSETQSENRPLLCMEIRGGNYAVDAHSTTPGLDLWVYSRPFEGDSNGGDVHYISQCGGGIVTRLVIADVSGHGSAVADMARDLRILVRKNINQKSHDRIVRELNREFTALAGMRRFATAVVATFLATTRRLTIANAGHPRPLVYRARTGEWSLVVDAALGAENLPWGIDDTARYSQVTLDLERGDLILFYTDALIETADHEGSMLGEEGLLDLMRSLPADDPQSLARELPRRLAECRQGAPAGDDETFLLVGYNGAGPRPPRLAEKFDVYAKVLGFRSV
jgi:phosphoserine phosphatase RsbU/P